MHGRCETSTQLDILHLGDILLQYLVDLALVLVKVGIRKIGIIRDLGIVYLGVDELDDTIYLHR